MATLSGFLTATHFAVTANDTRQRYAMYKASQTEHESHIDINILQTFTCVHTSTVHNVIILRYRKYIGCARSFCLYVKITDVLLRCFRNAAL